MAESGLLQQWFVLARGPTLGTFANGWSEPRQEVRRLTSAATGVVRYTEATMAAKMRWHSRSFPMQPPMKVRRLTSATTGVWWITPSRQRAEECDVTHRSFQCTHPKNNALTHVSDYRYSRGICEIVSSGVCYGRPRGLRDLMLRRFSVSTLPLWVPTAFWRPCSGRYRWGAFEYAAKRIY